MNRYEKELNNQRRFAPTGVAKSPESHGDMNRITLAASSGITWRNQRNRQSKKLYVESSFIFNIFWQIADFIIGGLVWFMVAISDVFSGRFLGIIGSFIDVLCFRFISLFAIFGIYL